VKAGDVINGYRILEDFRVVGAGLSKWTFAAKDGREYFIKEFLSPTFPDEHAPGSAQTKFRTRWAAHNVRQHQTGRKRLHHPVVGDLELTYEVLALPADPGLSLVVYGAEPGSASQDGLKLLASWAATLDQSEHPEAAQAPEDA
jgi:hypothetical protein